MCIFIKRVIDPVNNDRIQILELNIRRDELKKFVPLSFCLRWFPDPVPISVFLQIPRLNRPCNQVSYNLFMTSVSKISTSTSRIMIKDKNRGVQGHLFPPPASRSTTKNTRGRAFSEFVLRSALPRVKECFVSTPFSYLLAVMLLLKHIVKLFDVLVDLFVTERIVHQITRQELIV